MPHLISFDFSLPLAFMFDLDGTILDSTKCHMQAYRETLARYAPNKLPEFKEDIIKGRGSKDVFLALGFTDNKEISKLVEHKRELYNSFIQNKKVCLFDGVKDLLNFLKSRHRILILVTSSCNNTAKLSLEANELTSTFDYTVTGEQVEFGKPEPDIFQYALQLTKLESCQAVTIEDSEIGIQASTAAGIPVVLVNQEKNFPNVPTFSTVKNLLDYVRCDFEKAELGILLQAILSEQNASPKITWDSSFGERPLDYNPTSDQELFNVFKLASGRKKRIRLLRIGGPLLFRRMVISYLNLTGSTESRNNNAVKCVVDKRIPSIRFLIADPDGVPFLTRLDYEKAGTWGIWRVRDETLYFAMSLCTLAKLRNVGELEVGFHRGELIWNLGIVGETAILVRAYGRGTGHDSSIASQWIKTGEKISFAESFTNYWEAIARRADTKWMKLDFFKDYFKTDDSEPKWPSLYKGNGILSNKDDLDKEDYERIIPGYVSKICRHLNHHNAERDWLFIDNKQRNSFKHFRPVKKAQLGAEVPLTYERTPVVMERLIGYSLFEIANEISINKKSKENPEAASKLLGEILLDSIKSLKEFRDHTNSVIPENKRKPYPYESQLIDALDEVKSFIGPISSDVFDEARKEVSKLGKNLNSKISFPFRDAQLKNRIWVTNESISEMVNHLLKIVNDHSALQSEMKNIRDIDFETSCFNVTPWDDIIHILFFEKSKILFFEKERAGKLKPSVDPIKSIESYKDWCGKVDDEAGLWMTVLARSLREFCRRLWYARNMPNTYTRRYKLEKRDYFLDLALCAVQKLPKYKNIRDLLVGLKESPDLWSSIGNNKKNNNEDESKIVAFPPEKLSNPSETNKKIESFEYDVFISYSHKDESIVRALADHLNNDGLHVWLAQTIIQPGESIPLKIGHGLKSYNKFLMCMSPSYFESDWGSMEYLSQLFRDPINKYRRLIPILIADCTIPDIIAHLSYIDWRTQSDDQYNMILVSCQKNNCELSLVKLVEQKKC